MFQFSFVNKKEKYIFDKFSCKLMDSECVKEICVSTQVYLHKH